MAKGVDWAGDCGADCSHNITSTSAPSVGQGGSKCLDWAGNCGMDTTHTMESTHCPNGPMPGGSGSVQFVGGSNL